MKISYSWLKNYLNLDISYEEVSELLTNIGLEVEGVEEVESIKGGLVGVVIGEVLTKIQHPNADRLAITTVDVGKDIPLQIVCGAPNVAIGQKVPVATVGTKLYDGQQSFKIKKSKIRGQISEGMICGADEIGLGEETDGIMVLDSSAKSGTLASEYFQLKSDIVFIIGLTPNRSDAMGHIGVARDLMTVLNYKGNKLEMCLPSVDAFKTFSDKKNISVEIVDSKLCPRYSAVSISGIKVSPSPDWIQKKLIAIGLTPLNNVVDITNYVLHETGQPLHAFDIAKISGNKVVVSTLKDKTKFHTLDGVERELSSEDLMINNAEKPMCIAGVYGGIDSGINSKTVDVFIESAFFDPISIRKTAKRHGLSTDASFRYERGCDPNITVYALKRAALLITEICGGEIASDLIDIYPNQVKHFPVKLDYKKMDSLIGEVIDRKIVKQILNDLEIKILDSNNDSLSLLVPPYRNDVKRDVDVIEEILRIYGFNNVSVPSNLKTIISYTELINQEDIRNTISDLLSNNGFSETMNNSLINVEYTKLIPELNKDENVVILNPLSKEHNVMRQSLLFSGLENIAYNQNRKIFNVKIFEFGNTYHKQQQIYSEKQHLQLLMCGKKQSENWNTNADKIDFFSLKEKVEHILNRLGIRNFSTIEDGGWGMSFSLNYIHKNNILVRLGRVNNNLCSSFGVNSDVYMADFNWDLILEIVSFSSNKFQEISKFPIVRRDLSLLVDKTVSFDELKMIAINSDNKILKSVNLFDFYEGDKLPEGKKSYALSFTMGDKTKTLTDKQVDRLMKKIMENYKKLVSAVIR